MSANRPINADVPADRRPAGEPAEEPKQAPANPKAPRAKRRRRPIPGALKAIFALVVVAIVFIVAAVLGGSGGPKSDSGTAVPAAAPTAGSAPAPAKAPTEQLGYPAFATDNTTRVGGSDPVTNAAAVALAVFPSTVPSQRPAAVTLVGEDDWAGAIAASVLVSAPVRAPILVSNSDGLPDPSSEALAALAPQGAKATAGASAFAIGDVAVPDTGKVTRVKAVGAAATAAAIAELRDRLFGSSPTHIVIAPSEQPQFAMPAAAWAARSGDPVLFAEGDVLPEATLAALKRHKNVPVYVLGPSSAISSKAIAAIAKVSGGVHRVAGKDPVASAIAF
ncbi:MAG: hypothetical protein JWM24_1305, partial [Solirubrobacterales bacterium]|nr:hypothetical protein [Solirubrobacterales bacterium]